VSKGWVRERWRSFWFELEDPRPMALYRVLFAFFLVCNVNGLAEHFAFLFTAEGLFTGAEARAVFSSDSIVAPQSFLYRWDSRDAFWIHLALLECCACLFMVGAWTRVSGVLTLVLMDSLFSRNRVFWEGTELVFRVFLVYLVCSRCGEAYSVDRWRRARRSPGVLPLRGIPAWPRRLVLLQMAALLLATGLAKSGPTWIEGDAVYYMLRHEHLPRVPMDALCIALGTNLLRIATWAARAIEVLYPLVLVGVIARRGRRGAWWDWCFGRRIWALAAVALMVAQFVLVNIGQFHTAMLASFVPLLSGTEVGRIVRDRADMPVAGGLAYSRLGRVVASALLAWHMLAVAVELLPDRITGAGLRSVTRPWLLATRTMQSWGMWAPDAPREVVVLEVVILDDAGATLHVVTDTHPVPWIFYDRAHKIARRIASTGVDGPYARPFARWHCREWARTHDGALPHSVELRTRTRTIPPPESANAPSLFDGPILIFAHDC
jgi:hypothetical protein